jgi:tetratricopeptide (TPR) repeat protein
MSDESRGERAVPLERPVRIRRSWLRRLLRLAIVCLGVAIVAEISDIGLLDQERECAAAVHNKRQDAVAVCQRAYQDDQDPVIGVLLANAQLAAGDKAAGKRLAEQLLTTPQRSDALQMLGRIARDADKNDDAATMLEEARRLHRIERRSDELAGDDGVLAMVRVARSEFVEALQLVDECLHEAELGKNAERQRICHLAAARTLIQIGYWSAAEQELESARQLSTTDHEHSSLAYQRGNLASETGKHLLAISLFQNALRLRLRGRPQDNPWILKTELDLAYSSAEEHKFDDARGYLADATVRDSDHEYEPLRTWVAARIAYCQDELAKAASLVEKYFQLRAPDDSSDRDDRIDVAVLGAQIELKRYDLERARYWAERGIEQAELVRGAQSVLELRPSVLTKRRAPYELLFVALAGLDQVETAAMVFDQWQGRTVQDALARSQPPASLDFRGMADHIARLGKWLPVASHAAFARSPDPDTVLHTMRDIDLLALIVANGDVWRLTANHGPPRLDRLGSVVEINELVDRFRSHPTTELQAASALADRLLPDELFRTTRESLHVVIDGQLPPLPLAALRRGGTPLVAMRPIVRALRLPETPCVHVMRSGHATVLAYAAGNLPNTRPEAEQVGPLLQAATKIGGAATKAALRSAAHDAVLHVATHGNIGMDGASLTLADGEMSALEILAHGIGPSLAVLSACDVGASSPQDFELAGSLVAGFLGAGSQHVVATLSAVFDVKAPEIATQFYRAGGVADPVRALQTVQSALAKTNNVDWPYFVVFGPDVCPEDATEPR